MTNKLKRLIAPNPGLAVAFALIAITLIVAVHAIGGWWRAESGWLLVAAFVALLIGSSVYARIVAEQAWTTEKLIEFLCVVAEESNSWRPALADDAVFGKPDDAKLRRAIEKLSKNVDALRQDKHQTEMVLENMADGIIAVDPEGRINLFNRAAGSMLGRRESAVTGQKLGDVDLHPEIVRLASLSLAQKTFATSEITLAGTPQRIVSVRAAPFAASSTGADCAMVILHDLSEIRRHEQNQKEFVSNVSHELKTPITAIRTTAEALAGGAKNDEEVVDRFLNTIVSESDRLSALIDDLLEIAKRDSGITRTHKSNVGIAKVVKNAIDAVLPQAEQKNITVGVDVENGLSAYCDEMQIVQLVRNLADNAVKYTMADGSVHISACSDDGRLMISVRDTGIGIPHGEIARIFERFYRVDKARSRRLGGTGLGLAIVKDIVEGHGGEISVDTQLGNGSAFNVVLPGYCPSETALDADSGM